MNPLRHALLRTSLPAALLLSLSGAAVTAQSTTALLASGDNTLYVTQDGGLSNGIGAHFFVGVSGFNTPARVRRGVLSFNLAGIPAGARITGAELVLNMSRAQGAGPDTPINLHRLLASWGEGASNGMDNEGRGAPSGEDDATWLHRFYPSVLWNTPGGDFEAQSSGSTVVGQAAEYRWSGPGLVDDVQFWLDNPSQNAGWILIGDESGAPFTAKRFDSRQNPDENLHPRLEVTFEVLPAASAELIGSGCGIPGQPPFALDVEGLPVLGSPDFALSFTGGLQGFPIVLWFSFVESQQSTALGNGCSLHLDLASVLGFNGAGVIGPFVTGPEGSLFVPVPVPDSQDLLGFSLEVQGATSGSVFGLLMSDAWRLTFGV